MNDSATATKTSKNTNVNAHNEHNQWYRVSITMERNSCNSSQECTRNCSLLYNPSLFKVLIHFEWLSLQTQNFTYSNMYNCFNWFIVRIFITSCDRIAVDANDRLKNEIWSWNYLNSILIIYNYLFSFWIRCYILPCYTFHVILLKMMTIHVEQLVQVWFNPFCIQNYIQNRRSSRFLKWLGI